MKFSEAINVTMEQANKMSTSELREVVAALAPVINNTRNALISHGLNPSSLEGFENKGFSNNGYIRDRSVDPFKQSPGRMSINKLDARGKSTGVPKNRNELLNEVSRGLHFYNASDSSVGKQRKIMRDVEKKYNTKFKNMKQYSDFWNMVRRVGEVANMSAVGFESEEIIEEAIDIGVNPDISFEDIMDRLRRAYETKMDAMTAAKNMYMQGSSGIFSGNK